jgi:integrase
MPRKSSRIPGYRLHAQSGQAIVTLPDGFGGRRDFLLGPHDSPQSHAEYRRLVAEWLAAGRLKPGCASSNVGASLSVNELILAYWSHQREYHGWADDERGQAANLKGALRVVRELYGYTAAGDFGPKALKACREHMLGLDWARTYVNAQVGRVKRMFRWAAAEELLPVTVFQSLQTVEGLRAGKTAARETKPVRPVTTEHVEAVLPVVPLPVATMVRLQLIAGCRPAEVCMVRPGDIDTSNPTCWVYRPHKHKTERHGRERLVLIGPRGQEVLRPWLFSPPLRDEESLRLLAAGSEAAQALQARLAELGIEARDPDEYCFNPRASEHERNAARRAGRRTSMTPSQKARKPKAKRLRPHGNRYTTASYRQAIQRGCEKVGVPVWAPNQLRHSRATELRQHGLDLVNTILGHNKIETSQVYAEKDLAAAMELVGRVG